MEILFILTGLVIGAGVGYLFAQSRGQRKLSDAEVESKIILDKYEHLFNEFESLKKAISDKEQEILEMTSLLARKEEALKYSESKLKDQIADVKEQKDQLRNEFRVLANDILEEKSKRFTEQNKLNLDTLLKPLGERIKEFEKKVEDVYVKESQQRFSLKEEIKRLEDLNKQISTDAVNLTRALKGDSKAQGNWGEIILESILQKSGLVNGREYFVQKSYQTDNGSRLQPDVIIKYPGNRSIVVDSKVSLTSYERYASSGTEDERDTHLKAHLVSMKNHISELAAKNYQDLYQLNSLDFVMMFLPVEPAYLLAIEKDPELWSYAYKKRVLLISPTNLIAALKMVESMWRQEYQSKNVMEIARQSGDLYDKFVLLLKDLEDIGKKLTQTRLAYESSINKLSEGRGNLINRVEKIRKLGAKASKEMPKELLEKAQEHEEE